LTVPITKQSKIILKEIDSSYPNPFPTITTLKEELLKKMINHDIEIIQFLQSYVKTKLTPMLFLFLKLNKSY
jgi:hypothetical protein